MSEEILSVKDLAVSFPTEDGVVNAVRGVTYSLNERDVLGVVGESGSGKSVAAMALMGLLPKTAQITGDVRFRGQDVLAMTPKEQRSLRGRNIAMIFQDPMTAMNPVYTVGDQLAEAYRSHNRVERKVAMAQAVEMLDKVGIPQAKERAGSYPHEFSGGMRQRAMIAMAIINNPDIIIADEPTTALDVTVQAQILETLVEIKDAVNAAVILITHDLGVVAGMAHKVLVMYAGKGVERADVDDIYRRPRMPYTAGLLGSVPALDSAGGRLHPITGAPPSLINLPPGCPFSPRCPLATEVCQTSEPELAPTDLAHHEVACHHWEQVAEVDDPTTLFRSQAVAQ
jgi:peptide/nickel transport system ATP-binding protein